MLHISKITALVNFLSFLTCFWPCLYLLTCMLLFTWCVCCLCDRFWLITSTIWIVHMSLRRSVMSQPSGASWLELSWAKEWSRRLLIHTLRLMTRPSTWKWSMLLANAVSYSGVRGVYDHRCLWRFNESDCCNSDMWRRVCLGALVTAMVS